MVLLCYGANIIDAMAMATMTASSPGDSMRGRRGGGANRRMKRWGAREGGTYRYLPR